MANPYLVSGLTIGGIGGLALLVGWSRKAHAGAPTVTPDNLLNQILFLAKQKKLGNQELVAKMLVNVAATAKALGLTKTAAAAKSDSALPTDENWPGTNMSVKAYVEEALKAQAAA